ncbi:hypothetical protein [Enterococcus villorum]|nr:hypothetical protein [Enterococcus villorum]
MNNGIVGNYDDWVEAPVITVHGRENGGMKKHERLLSIHSDSDTVF